MAKSSMACRRQGLPSPQRTNVLDNAACSNSKPGRRARQALLGSASNGNLANLGPYLAQLRDEIMACLQRFPDIRSCLRAPPSQPYSALGEPW